jgi:hypothetical protein
VGTELGAAHAVVFKEAGAVLAVGGGNHIWFFFVLMLLFLRFAVLAQSNYQFKWGAKFFRAEWRGLVPCAPWPW